jgi:membrane protease YdiL (CAAX protease family)
MLAPWLCWGANSLARHVHFLEPIAASPFHRFVNRAILILALGGLWPFLRYIKMRSWEALGLTQLSSQWKNVALGFSWGFVSLALVAAVAFAAGVRTWNGNLTLGRFAGASFNALISAVVVAVLEEVLFRGALLGSLRRSHPWPVALSLSSLVYGLVHFFQNPQEPAEVTWWSGFWSLGRMLARFVDPGLLIPGLLTLLVAGGILGLAFLRTGKIYLSIGLHAGWIFWLRLYGRVATETPSAREHAVFWGTGKLFDGWLAFIILLPVLLVFWRNYSRVDEGRLEGRIEKLA